MSQAEQWITRAMGDRRTVTFRELSRAVGCHVHASKNLMQAYYATHPDVVPTYLLSGPLFSTATLAKTSIVDEAPAGATQSLAHMSATQKIRIVDMDQMSDDERNSEADAEEERKEAELEQSGDAMDEDGVTDEKEEVAKWGVVLAAQETLDDKKKLFINAEVHIYSLSPSRVKDPAQFIACTLNVRQKSANADVYGTITGDAIVAGTKPLRDGGMDFSKKVVKKDVKEEKPKVEEKKPEIEKEKPKVEKIALRKSSNKRRIITSDDEAEAPSKSASPKPTTASSSKLEPTSSMVRADDQAAMEAMMDMDFDFDDEDTSTKPSATKGAKRKTRRVKKSKVEMDDKGYMVTKDYYTDETYSGSDTDTEPLKKAVPKSAPPPTKPKAPAAASSAPAGGVKKKGPTKPAPMGQSTLAGFFKKK